ncbi:MAG: aspartate carbamoyltransferase [Candidatus Omnitrophica bacterium CG12_big_fil_rev_8_21_14_0_65_43_15]|uniref:Aspartate carbamoyltransferase n=1 Tax=Candidatus Taenaricola geysiri TaxID=1974752 RepID=A0A2J0LS78_9BACT|nr:MAG: aspartate carbamoyltransferase [Candidatus Omnitrophica bacterium CG1_02_43_210]PIR65416.1 MAG: aspartate carbamoyltransferase [Candidatus Omnitrophica bacterium CG10_big_fil_rev_8_21_14_0_10_43_8]PIV12316.1 MAG: aspartate carbamoyltransferase [Candidatus Omnitrophica bacterium CG03_land_8_20_14_0_80_43_22]PIW66697.1 MAG: aspartate carbamoyltransferase [Candidatus Omnitrophica bacterium CG12_big_fil_rev_8_21_14_0_65_43_15]PIW79960.1 MAG: aspartate carbamoyltransferase [Candidatus Omnitr
MNTRKTIVWTKKDLLGLEYLSRQEIELILSTAESFKEVTTRQIKKVPALRGKTVVNLFYEPSTRTRVSFEVAAKRLSADVINISTETSSVKKGETLVDTGKNIEALKVDTIIMRHNCSGAAAMLARHVSASVINAGDGWHEHPTQALLDMFTLKEKLGRIEGLKVSIAGDIAHSRVARSNIWGLIKLGAEVTVCAPKILIPPGIEKMGVKVTNNIDEALAGADAVNVLRMQFERDQSNAFPKQLEYFKTFGVTRERLKKAKKDIVVMHPGPINRGIEMSSEVADGANSVILEQVTNGIAVRMAVLFLVAQANERLKNENTD